MEAETSDILVKILKFNCNDIDFLANRILLNCSAVLLGCKPASAITFNAHSTVKEVLPLWDTHKGTLFKDSRLQYCELCRDDRRILILVFDRKKLNMTLSKYEVALFLNFLGYNKDSTLDEKICTLKNRFLQEFPHEIGVFVGLPLKDVLGFMGISSLKLSCSMGWKIYGDAEPSISLFKHYEKCKIKIAHMLLNGTDPLYILRNYPSL